MVITIALIALTCAISFTGFQNRDMLERLIFWPPAVNRGEYHRLLTHGFLHADGQHLLFNMVTLFFFGRAIEGFFSRYIGMKSYLNQNVTEFFLECHWIFVINSFQCFVALFNQMTLEGLMSLLYIPRATSR